MFRDMSDVARSNTAQAQGNRLVCSGAIDGLKGRQIRIGGEG